MSINIETHSCSYFPIEMNDIQKKIIRESEKFSMTGRIRMSLLLKIIDHINLHNIEGDIVECGVWKGGNLICAQKYLDYLNLITTILILRSLWWSLLLKISLKRFVDLKYWILSSPHKPPFILL